MYIAGLSEQLLAERRAYKAAAAPALGKAPSQGSKRRLLPADGAPRNVKAKTEDEEDGPLGITQGNLSRLRQEALLEVTKAAGDDKNRQGVCPADAKGQLLEPACRSRGRCPM